MKLFNRRHRYIHFGAVLAFFLLLLSSSQQPLAASPNRAQKGGDPAGQIDYLTGPQAGEPLDIALNYVHQHHAELGLVRSDLDDTVVRDLFSTSHNGLTHIYLRQRLAGIEVFSGDIAVHIAADGRILALHNNFVPNLDRLVNAPSETILTAEQAVLLATGALGLEPTERLRVLFQGDGPDQEVRFSNGGFSLVEIPARLVYQPLAGGRIRLAWDLSIYPLDAQNYWSFRIDALNGDVLDSDDWVVSDYWGRGETGPAGTATITQSAVLQPTANQSPEDPEAPDQYHVYAMPAESPNHVAPAPPLDGRVTSVNPADSLASPYGWHDTNGATGPEFNTTQGNNAHAYTDTNANNLPDPGSSPSGGPSLNFTFPLDLSQPPSAYRPAAVTNLFYWNNVVHDVWYQYGFDEASGNFQQNNYGRGGLGSDYVLAEAQDGSGINNANFATPGDGSRPRMQMFIFTGPNPDKDGDLDNGIIAHEYGHGISNRLTGGPSNVSCLGNDEQMGEGWSDWFALMMTIEVGDSGTDRRGMGTYVLDQPTTGNGIRDYPYSTNLAVDPRTYDDIKDTSFPHPVGSIWAAMIWDVTWAFIDVYGFDPDFYNGTGGNNMAMQLIMDGMKLQSCSPGFVDGRTAILQADLINHGGAHQCLIWNAFAKRGLGYSADQGLSTSRNDGTEAFDLPPGCMMMDDGAPEIQSICTGDTAGYSVWLGSDFTPPINMSLSGHPLGTAAAFTPNPVSTDETLSFLTVQNTVGAVPGTYAMTVTASGGLIDTESLVLNILASDPATPVLASPANNAAGVSPALTLSWDPVIGGASYTVDIATDPAFANIVATASGLADPSYSPGGLNPETIYYWRVKVDSSCGSSAFSPTRNFFTGGLSCTTEASVDVPKTIPVSINPVSVSSTLPVVGGDTIVDINVLNLTGTHTWINDLAFNLESPLGTTVQIMAQSCGSQDNFALNLDDEAAPGPWPCPPVGGGTYQPSNPLSGFDGQNSTGIWTLTINDYFPGADGGSLNSWSLEFCYADNTPADYSDLALGYGVAWHTGDGSLRFGSNWSADSSFAADSDDDSDGGVSRTGNWGPDNSVSIELNVSGADGNDYAACWIDWDNDGQFSAGEKHVLSGAPVNGNNSLTLTVPAGYDPATDPVLDTRCRLYEDEPLAPVGTETPAGGRDGGEVQDHRFQFSPTAITLTSNRIGSTSSPAILLFAVFGLQLLVASLMVWRFSRQSA